MDSLAINHGYFEWRHEKLLVERSLRGKPVGGDKLNRFFNLELPLGQPEKNAHDR